MNDALRNEALFCTVDGAGFYGNEYASVMLAKMNSRNFLQPELPLFSLSAFQPAAVFCQVHSLVSPDRAVAFFLDFIQCLSGVSVATDEHQDGVEVLVMVDVVGVVLGLLPPVHRVKVEAKVASLDGLEERSERLGGRTGQRSATQET